MKANATTLFNSNKKMPLYIRHSCCIKIPQSRANSTPFSHLRHHYSTHLTTTKNPAIPYFITLFTVSIKIISTFYSRHPLSHILLHKKRPHLAVRPVPFLLSQKRGNGFLFFTQFFICLFDF